MKTIKLLKGKKTQIWCKNRYDGTIIEINGNRAEITGSIEISDYGIEIHLQADGVNLGDYCDRHDLIQEEIVDAIRGL